MKSKLVPAFRHLNPHFIGQSRWYPEEIYVALATEPDFDVNQEPDFEITEPDGNWYSRQPLDSTKWKFVWHEPTSSTVATYCGKVCFGPSREREHAVTPRSIWLVDTPEGDGVAIAGFGSCGTFIYGTRHGYRRFAFSVASGAVESRDARHVFPSPDTPIGIIMLTEDGATAIAKHLTGVDELKQTPKASCLTVAFTYQGLDTDFGSNSKPQKFDAVVTEATTPEEIPLLWDDDKYAIYTEGDWHFEPPSEDTGIHGVRFYADTTNLGEIFIQGNPVYRGGIPGSDEANLAADKCKGARFNRDVLGPAKLPFNPGLQSFEQVHRPLHFRLI